MKKSKKGTGKQCAVYGCRNNSKRLRKWKLSPCEIHSESESDILHEHCTCRQPYQMHRIPHGTSRESCEVRREWLKNINRKNFRPVTESRVCSIHFIDGRPTADHPYPTVEMGYKPYRKLSVGRPAPRRRVPCPTVKLVESTPTPQEETSGFNENLQHSYVQTGPEQQKDASVQWYDATIADHSYHHVDHIANSRSEATQTNQIPEVSVPELDDAGVKFYTGLSKQVFWAFLNSLLMCMSVRPKFRLGIHDQVLLVLMRLRLGLMFTDLAARFKVSRTTACDIFALWLPIMARYVRENLLFWPSRDTLARIRPKCFFG